MNIQKHFQKIQLLFVLTTLLLVTSCGNDSNKNFSEVYIIPDTESFSSTTNENTASVSKSVMSELESYDANTGRYVFSKNADVIEDLKLGTTVLFQAHSLRKIKSVTSDGGQLIVETEFARLTDYFKDAEINYSTAINWSESTAANTKMTVGQPIATIIKPLALQTGGVTEQEGIASVGDEGIHVQMEKEINGWKVGFILSPEAGNKLKIKLSAEKGNVCSIVAEGYISSFTSNMNIVINNSETNAFSYSNDGIEGELEVKFSAVGLGSEIAIIQIPAKIERTILVNGIIPVTLRLKANLKILPEVAVGSSSQVSMKLKYNSNTGFDFDGSKLNPIGSVSQDNPEQTGDCNTATTAIAGMGVNIEFPRFEVGVFGNLVVPYLLLSTNYSSYLSTGLMGGAPPCHLARLKYKAHAGVSMNFLGVAAINNDYKLFEKEKKWTSEGSQCEE